MGNVLTQTVVYVLLLAVGYGFKKAGIFKPEDSAFLKSVILYITMPAVAINGMKDLQLQSSFAWCFLTGLVTCTALMAVGLAASRGQTLKTRIFYLFNMNSFNVGNFAIPFLTGLISENGFAALCLFDIAVAMYLYGVSYSMADMFNGAGGVSIRQLLKKIVCSPIIDAYLLMLLLAALNLRLPAPVLRLAEVAGGANAFLAMLSIGILFELKVDRRNLMEYLKFFALRYGTALLIAAGVYFLLPLPADIRQALCVLLMAPVASVAPLLTRERGGDGARSAQINSISILTSIAMMVAMYAITG